MSTPTPEYAIDAVDGIRKRLIAMSTCEPLNQDPVAVRALERAASWLGDITNPITDEEYAEWIQNVGTVDADILCDDQEDALNTLDETSTDEDKRQGLKDYHDYQLNNKEKNNADNK